MDSGSDFLAVPQAKPLNEEQVLNNAGGYVFKIDDFSRLRRFIILGSNGNNYYISDKEQGLENCECVLRLLAGDRGLQVVEEVTRISREGRAPRQSTGILVLAVCARLGDLATRRAALAALPAVCRTASTLFELVQRCKELGPATRAARLGDAAADPQVVMAWLQSQKAAALAAAYAAADAEADAADASVGSGGRGSQMGGRGRGVAGGRGRGRGSPSAMPLLASGSAADGKPSWGRSMRRAIALWYLEKSPAAVAYQATKYSQRHGWSHADLLRLAHPDPEKYASKRRKLASTAATAKMEGTGSGDTALEPDSEWVMVSQKPTEGEEVIGKGVGDGASELDALLVAMENMATRAASEGVQAMAATAAEAQRVADMKAIFDFLTHGTLPGQERPARRVKRPREPAEGVSTAEVDGGAATGAKAAETGTGCTDANSSQAAAITLSPVMQYLADAYRLRKEIRAPPPLVKPQPPPGVEFRRQLHKVVAKWRRSKRKEPEVEELGVTVTPQPPPDPEAVAANEAARASATDLAVSLIRRHRFGHEHVGDTTLLQVPEVWAAFLDVGMPLTAMVRNLGRMTQMGLLKQRPEYLATITQRLRDSSALAAARLHPMTLLDALCTYRAGAGARGVARWECEPAVAEALEAAFYLAFKNVRPTGRRYLIGLDVSGSMKSSCAGMTSVRCHQAAAAMLMCLVRTESWVKTLAFSDKLVPMELKAEDKLEDVVARAESISMGGTCCSLPIIHATDQRIPVDVFIILTDNETWYGDIHPSAALQRYRSEMNLPDAKLVVLAFNASQFSIADPEDPGMLDIAGLDSAVPQIVADFVAGRM